MTGVDGIIAPETNSDEDYLVLIGELVIETLRMRDILTIRDYGYSNTEIERLLNGNRPAQRIGYLAAWIREAGGDRGCGYSEDWRLDEDGNYPMAEA